MLQVNVSDLKPLEFTIYESGVVVAPPLGSLRIELIGESQTETPLGISSEPGLSAQGVRIKAHIPDLGDLALSREVVGTKLGPIHLKVNL